MSIIKSAKKSKLLSNIIRGLILWILSLAMILPLLWMITASLKTNSSIMTNPPQWIPKEFAFENFKIGLKTIDFWPRFGNTIFITFFAVIGQVLSSTMIGYGIARIKFPGRRFWFYCIIGSMMLPSLISLIPVFKLFTAIGFYNTYLPLILPAFLGGPFYTFLIRQFLMGVPRSFDEAAKIDGAGHFRVLFQILVPIIKPAIIVIVIMQFQASWNDYLSPLVYLADSSKWTLSLAVASFISNYAVEWNKFMAADLIYMLPSLLLFFCAQKYFMQGFGSLTTAGLK